MAQRVPPWRSFLSSYEVVYLRGTRIFPQAKPGVTFWCSSMQEQELNNRKASKIPMQTKVSFEAPESSFLKLDLMAWDSKPGEQEPDLRSYGTYFVEHDTLNSSDDELTVSQTATRSAC